MVDMHIPSIAIWEGCDPTVSAAIMRFQDRWRPSSGDKHSVRLIEELVDPAVSAYTAVLPQRYLNYVPGIATGAGFGKIVQLVGLDATARQQRRLLMAFTSTEDRRSAMDERFVATLESLIGLVGACVRKRPTKAKVRDTRLNRRRVEGFCRCCGALAELPAFSEGSDSPKADDPEDKLRLSSLYCSNHRPKLPNGEWNPAYRKAKRSLSHFDLELARISLQSAQLKAVHAQSGDPLVDSYIYHYVRKYGFQPADEAEMRHHARWMADKKFSDRKKQIVMLVRYGVSQSEIARKLGVERQAVFKALASIPAEFRQLPMLSGFPSCFLM